MKISVVVLAYNHGNYLAQTLDSILTQDCPELIEIVVAEDCSQDDTLAIAAMYQQQYPAQISLLAGGPNLGMMKNLARAFAHCSGDYIALCEGDDYWLSTTKLTRQCRLLRDNPAAIMCISQGLVLTPDGTENVLGDFGAKDELISTRRLLAREGIIAPTASFVFRAALIRDLPRWFYQAPVADVFLLLAAARDYGVMYLADVTCAYRLFAAGSWSSRLNVAQEKVYLAHCEAMIRHYHHALTAFRLQPRWLGLRLSAYRWVLAKAAWRQQQYSMCWRHLIRIPLRVYARKLRALAYRCVNAKRVGKAQ